MNREEMAAKVLWNTGGHGLGICSVAIGALWGMDTPSAERPDYPSMVAVNGNPEDYTDEERIKIVAFSERVTAHYDKMFNCRRGCNLIIIGKPTTPDGKWFRKRLTWQYGPMYSSSLDEALKVMERG